MYFSVCFSHNSPSLTNHSAICSSIHDTFLAGGSTLRLLALRWLFPLKWTLTLLALASVVASCSVSSSVLGFVSLQSYSDVWKVLSSSLMWALRLRVGKNGDDSKFLCLALAIILFFNVASLDSFGHFFCDSSVES